MGMLKESTAVLKQAASEASGLKYTEISKMESIVTNMRSSFATGKTKDMSFRRAQLKSLLQGVREQRQSLLDALYLDLHKSSAEAELTEVGAVEYEIGCALDNLKKWAKPDRNSLSMSQPGFILSSMEVRKEPLGTVLIIGPWNYPLRLIIMVLVGAIAAGNTVVIKPSEVASNTAVAIEDLVEQYLDPSAVCVVQGGVAETTELLKQHFDYYFYTGNGSVGRIVARAAAEHLAGVTLELGGKSPVIVHSDVGDLKPVATRLMWAKLTNAGQTCVAADYVLVHRSVKDKLLDLCVQAVHGMYTEHPQKSPDYGRIINKRHWARLQTALQKTQGTAVHITDDEADENDCFIPPTIIDGVRPDDSLMADEIFGPILPVLTYDSLDEAIAIVNSRDQPLALYAFGGNASCERIINSTRSGGAVVNDAMFHLASHNNPFGGVGPSGVGRYQGKYSFDTFSHHRSVLKRPLWFPSPGIDTLRTAPTSGPENAWKASLSKALLFPSTWSLRTSWLGKLYTLIPFWRYFSIVVPFVRGLISSRSLYNQKKK